jgi:hypothetical protein
LRTARGGGRRRVSVGLCPREGVCQGCDRGLYTHELARRGWEAVGVDNVPRAIDAASHRGHLRRHFRGGRRDGSPVGRPGHVRLLHRRRLLRGPELRAASRGGSGCLRACRTGRDDPDARLWPDQNALRRGWRIDGGSTSAGRSPSACGGHPDSASGTKNRRNWYCWHHLAHCPKSSSYACQVRPVYPAKKSGPRIRWRPWPAITRARCRPRRSAPVAR